MPRKRKTLDEQLQSIQMEMDACERKLATLKQEYHDVEQKKKEAELNDLYKTIAASGLSIAEVKDMLCSENTAAS